MLPYLNAHEARVIGCLIEKSVVTPDQYPLTLNALTNACNQKSSRDPVMSLTQGQVQHTIRDLQGKHFVLVDENFRGRAEKYSQRFCNTRYSDLQFDAAQLAIVCLLLLRGPQTPGELKARAGRLHSFESNDTVVDTLDSLVTADADPLVVRLARAPGRRDAQYMHLFSGAVDAAPADEPAAPRQASVRPSAATIEATVTNTNELDELTARVSQLESEVATLKALLAKT